MGSIEREIDKVLENLVSKARVKDYEKWRREYRDRLFDKIRPKCIGNPAPQNKQYSAFEANLISQLFCIVRNKDPHCEWPYISHVRDVNSRQRADFVYIQPADEELYEVWIEIKMYVSELHTYEKDFNRLKKLVDACNWCIGVVLHLESEPRGRVFDLFNSLKKKNGRKYNIDIKKIGNEETIHLVRLIIRK
jgi:hypothetical protein